MRLTVGRFAFRASQGVQRPERYQVDETYLLKIAADLKVTEDHVAICLWAKQRELRAIEPDKRWTGVIPQQRKRVVELEQDIACLQSLSIQMANAVTRIQRFVDWLSSSEKQQPLPFPRAVTS
jgi:accessory colonization factor AcfC